MMCKIAALFRAGVQRRIRCLDGQKFADVDVRRDVRVGMPRHQRGLLIVGQIRGDAVAREHAAIGR